MIITLEPGLDCHSDLRVEIPADFVSAEREKILNAVVKQARIPGYRPGKVPRQVVEKRFNQTITGELEADLANKAISQAAREKELRVLHVFKSKSSPNQDGSYTVTADLLLTPKFALPLYKGIQVEVPGIEITEEHMSKALESMLRQQADYRDLPDDAKVAMGHIVTLDYDSKYQGEGIDLGENEEQLRPAFSGTNRMLKVDEEALLPGFCGELIDRLKGEPFSFSLQIPENFPLESLRGQTVTYEATISKVVEQVIPELNDETAKQISRDDAMTADLIKDRVREGLRKRSEGYVRQVKAEGVMKFLHEELDFELPKEMVTYETQQQVNQIVRRSLADGASNDLILEHEDKIVDSAGIQARQEVKTNFIMNEIAKAESIQVSESDVFNRIAYLAEQANIPLKKALQNVKKNGSVNTISQQILVGKVLDFLIENANVQTDESLNALDQLLGREGNPAIPAEL